MGAVGFDYCDSGLVTEEMLAYWVLIDPNRRTIETKDPAKHMPLLIQGPSLFQFGSGTRTFKVFDLQYLTREPQMGIESKRRRKRWA